MTSHQENWLRMISLRHGLTQWDTNSRVRPTRTRYDRAIPCILASIQWMLLFVVVAGVSGCRSFSIPRIDPTGQRIFLPDPYRVGLSDALTHTDRNGLPQKHGFLPESSFPAPPAPPPCIDGSPTKPVGCGLLDHHKDRGECGQLLLTPTTIVAPVGGEVVLLAGICGEDGHLVTKEPIEWMLSPESVGTFIEVGDDAKGKPLREWHAKPKVQKLDVDYAKGRTSAIESVITRGSARTSDDLPLKKGQTWISISSPAEGTSRVTALAPDSQVWDQRRQTATIYWVDAQWKFPEPVTTLTGQSALLSTQVFQSEGFVGAKGWRVLYRSLNPEIAKFLPSGSEIAEVTVDENGRANVELQNITNANGTAIVAIEVIRPQQERMAAITLARGQAIVTWSSPRILVQAGGPEFASPGQRLTYGASLINDGDLPAENAVLQIAAPAGMNIVDATPKPTSLAPNSAVWQFGQLQAREARNVSIQVEANSPVDGRIQFSGAATSSIQPGQGIQTQDSKAVDVRIAAPSLQLRMEPAQQTRDVEIGREVLFNISVVNTGNTSLNNLRLQITSDQGLQESRSNDNNVLQVIPFLGAGEKRDLSVSYIVRREGELKAELVASSNDVRIAQTSAFVQGVQAVQRAPGLSIELIPENGQPQVDANGERLVAAVITNTGQTQLTGVRVSIDFDPAVDAVSATNDGQFNPQNRSLTWDVPTALNPGDQVANIKILFRAANDPNRRANQAQIRAIVMATQNVNARNALVLGLGGSSVLPNNAPVLPNNNGSVMPNNNGPVMPNNNGSVLPNNQGGTGNEPLSLELVAPSSPLFVNQDSTMTLVVRNNQNKEDRNLVVSVEVPSGVLLRSLTQVGPNYGGTFDTSTRINSAPVQFVRAGETVSWQLVIRPQQAYNSIPIRVLVTSSDVPTGIQRQQNFPVSTN